MAGYDLDLSIRLRGFTGAAQHRNEEFRDGSPVPRGPHGQAALSQRVVVGETQKS